MRDALWDGLTDSYANTPMGMTAENLARKYNIAREVSLGMLFDVV
jgi:acetyl-CoA acyltransferase 2